MDSMSNLSGKITKKLSSDFLDLSIIYINHDMSSDAHRAVYNNIEDRLWERLRSQIGFVLARKIQKDLEVTSG